MIYMYFRHKLEEETRAGGGGQDDSFHGLCDAFFPNTIYQRTKTTNYMKTYIHEY